MMVMKSVNVHLLIINRWCLSSDLVCPVRVYWIWMFPLFSDLIHLKRKLLFCIDNIYIILFIFYLWFVNKEILVSSASQSLHKDHFGLCEQQWERCVCAQQYTPHLPGGGQPHHGLRRHFTSAFCCNLFLCESTYIFICVCMWQRGILCVLNCGCTYSWWLQLQEVIHPHWPFPNHIRLQLAAS